MSNKSYSLILRNYNTACKALKKRMGDLKFYLNIPLSLRCLSYYLIQLSFFLWAQKFYFTCFPPYFLLRYFRLLLMTVLCYSISTPQHHTFNSLVHQYSKDLIHVSQLGKLLTNFPVLRPLAICGILLCIFLSHIR